MTTKQRLAETMKASDDIAGWDRLAGAAIATRDAWQSLIGQPAV